MCTDKKAFNWGKRGLIITPQKGLWWMQTHAMLPTIDYLEGSIFKIFFSGRDKENRSHIGYAIIDFKDSVRVLEYSVQPILSLGKLGCFDDNGVTPSWVVNCQDAKFL